MDRPIIYPAEIVRSADFLTGMQSAMISDGMMLSTLLGRTATVVSGFQFIPSSPASLQFSIGQGAIISPQVVEQTPYGSLVANSERLTKMGINLGPTTFTLTAPSTPGQSITYLMEVAFLEQDTTPVLLGYYNSANPTQPYSGPGNNGTAQNTLRQQRASLQIKAGAAGNTGSQQIPTADVGWWPLWLITVNYGQTTISSASMAPGAPYLPNVLSTVRIPVTGSTLNLYVNASGGSDGNLGTSALYPLQTIAGAVARAASAYDLSNATVQINLAAGSYSGVSISGSTIRAPIVLAGASSNSTTITSSTSHSIQIVNGAQCTLESLTITNSSPNSGDYTGGSAGCIAQAGGLVFVGPDVAFGSCPNGPHLWAYEGGTITALSQGGGQGRNCRITGGATMHLYASVGGSIVLSDCTVTLTNTPAFTSGFANVSQNGSIGCWNNTYTGSATGYRYVVSGCGTINAQGQSASYLPGNQAGVQESGGQYI